MLIAARESFAAASRRRLPYDAEVEYLQSSGTQYIDTAVEPNGVTDFSVTMQLLKSGDISYNVFGSRDVSSGRPAFGLITHSTGPSISIARLSASSWNDLILIDYGRHVYSFRNDVAYYDGTPKGTNSGNVQLANSAYIFRFNNGGVAISTTHQRVFSVKLWQSGTLVRDFIPVRVGSGSSAVGYMYDKVSGTLFGNAGTGSFTIGPDKTA